MKLSSHLGLMTALFCISTSFAASPADTTFAFETSDFTTAMLYKSRPGYSYL